MITRKLPVTLNLQEEQIHYVCSIIHRVSLSTMKNMENKPYCFHAVELILYMIMLMYSTLINILIIRVKTKEDELFFRFLVPGTTSTVLESWNIDVVVYYVRHELCRQKRKVMLLSGMLTTCTGTHHHIR